MRGELARAAGRRRARRRPSWPRVDGPARAAAETKLDAAGRRGRAAPRPRWPTPRPPSGRSAERSARPRPPAPRPRRRLAEAEDAARAPPTPSGTRWTARAEALGLALDEARARAGAERLAARRRRVGTLLDLVEIDAGLGGRRSRRPPARRSPRSWSTASTAGRRALAALHGRATPSRRGARPRRSPAVAARVARRSASRSAPTSGPADRRRARCSTRSSAARSSSTAAGPAAVDAALAHPDAVVVTRDGDRFGPAGWRVGVAGHRRHRRRARGGRERADAAAAAAAATPRRASHGARSLLDEARQAEAALARQLDEHDGRLTAATDGARSGSRPTGATPPPRSRRSAATPPSSAERLGRDAGPGRRARARAARSSRPRRPTLAERARAMAAAREPTSRSGPAAVGALRADLEVRTGRRSTSAASSCARRLTEVEERLSRRSPSAARPPRPAGVELDRQADRRRPASPRSSTDRLADGRGRARRPARAAPPAVRGGPRPSPPGSTASAAAGRRRAALERARERPARAELDEAEIKLRLETAVEALRRDLDVEPDAAMARRAPELAEGVTPAARVRELERELRLMGPINPLALEEYEALQERHEFLEAQLDDVKASRRDLAKVIRAIDDEIVDVFAAAFADVAQNFEQLFETLFPGGTGRLRLTEPDDLLDTGIEVEAKPSGKNVQQALAAVRRRALAHRAGLPVRRVPQPAVALLRDGRGRGRPRRREPAPLPRPRRTSSARRRSSSS